LTCFVCVAIGDGSECGWCLREGTNFSLVDGLKILLASKGSSLVQTFGETCVDFDDTHVDVI